jgi:hypothetical protein
VRSKTKQMAFQAEPDLKKSSKTNSGLDHCCAPEGLRIPVWLHATESFYKKLNRVAKQCGLPRYEALSRGLDALRREFEIRTSPLNKAIRSPSQSEVFRRTMGQESRNYWATVSPEEKRARAQKSAQARWSKDNRMPQ